MLCGLDICPVSRALGERDIRCCSIPTLDGKVALDAFHWLIQTTSLFGSSEEVQNQAHFPPMIVAFTQLCIVNWILLLSHEILQFYVEKSTPSIAIIIVEISIAYSDAFIYVNIA
uniref:Uncharacterized protein n=1 Tax=Strigamia maritima TaxID=126957 RepID=T1JEG8_STRMM